MQKRVASFYWKEEFDLLVRPRKNFTDDCNGYCLPYEFRRDMLYKCDNDRTCSVYFVQAGLGGFFYERSEFEKHFMVEC